MQPAAEEYSADGYVSDSVSYDVLERDRGTPRSRSFLGRMLRAIAGVFLAPFRIYLSLRRSMTVASVGVLLALFMTLNVIWGFPWSGMMGGCLAMLFVGFAINRFMKPKLRVSVSLPRSAIAGHAFSINVRMSNPRRVPAMNLRVGWHYEGVRDLLGRRSNDAWHASPPVSVELLRSGDSMRWHGSMQFDRRGVHQLPPFRIVSTFPFHLFYCRRAVDTGTKIAITPAPINGEDDPTSRIMLAAIGDWAKQLVSGAPVEYIGNREYQVGVPVRRWDFASWARLGRPIVREYQSPSIQAVTLVVDTSSVTEQPVSGGRAKNRERLAAEDASFERLMSIAATTIMDLVNRRVQLKLYVTSESVENAEHAQTASQASAARERMLVRLAAAQQVQRHTAVRRICDGIEAGRNRPVLILSRLALDERRREEFGEQLPPNVTYLSSESSGEREESRAFLSGADG